MSHKKNTDKITIDDFEIPDEEENNLNSDTNFNYERLLQNSCKNFNKKLSLKKFILKIKLS
jgi:hypothetical protein